MGGNTAAQPSQQPNQQNANGLQSLIGNAPSQPVVGNNPQFGHQFGGHQGQYSPFGNEYHGFNQFNNGFGGFNPNGQPMQQPNLGYIQQPNPTVGGNAPSSVMQQPNQIPQPFRGTQGTLQPILQGGTNVAQPMGGLGAIPPRTA